MPSGRTHLRIETVLLAGWTFVAAILVRGGWVDEPEMAAFVIGYLFSMLLLSPDLDLATSDATRRWGPLRWLWAPYAAAFRHRRLSHHPLFGPITRIAYVGLLAWGGFAVYTVAGRGVSPQLVLPGRMTLAVLVGLYLPNLIHIAADGLHSLRDRLHRRL